MIYRFEDVVFDAERRELRRAGYLRPLEPQIFDLLQFLICNRERVVSRDEIFDAVWRERIVSGAALDTRINAARRAIGDSGREQRVIRTLRNKGFRFVGSVQEEAPRRSTTFKAENGRARALLANHPTIAVVPFACVGGGAVEESLADGITEDVITALAKIGWLFVTPRSSSFACKGRSIGSALLARKLGVRYLLEGGLRHADGRWRINMQLVDAIADHQIWAQRFDVETLDHLQDDICARVAAAVTPQLYAAEHIRVARKSAAGLNVWECIVRALSLMNSRDQKKIAAAHAALQKAVSIDPLSAQAYSLLSISATLRVHMSWTDRKAVIPGALASARQALSLNPSAPWAHAALGYALIWKQPEEGMIACQRAIELDPNFAIAHYFLALAAAYAGHRDHVFPHADMVDRLAPKDLLARGYVGAADNVRATGSFALERYREGAEFARRSAVYAPNSPTAFRALVMNLALGGNTHEAVHELRTLRRLAPQMSQNWINKNAVWNSDSVRKRYAEAFRIAGLK